MAYLTILSILFFVQIGQFSEKVLNCRGGWVGGVRCLGLSPKKIVFFMPSLMSIFYTDENFSSKFTPKTRKSRLIYFCYKMHKNLVYMLCLYFKISCFFQLQIFTPTLSVIHSIWVKCAGVWVNLPQ